VNKQEAAALAAAAHRRQAEGRREDFAELRSWGLTIGQAAERLGVTIRTGHRYAAALRQREQVTA
jgi:hypothetical protein